MRAPKRLYLAVDRRGFAVGHVEPRKRLAVEDKRYGDREWPEQGPHTVLTYQLVVPAAKKRKAK